MHSISSRTDTTQGNAVNHTARIRSQQRVLHDLSPCLQSRLSSFQSFEYSLTNPLQRLQLPCGQVSVVIGLGDDIELAPSNAEGEANRISSFAASSGHVPLLSRHLGTRSCIEIVMSPWAAYECFDGENIDFGSQPVPLEDLFGRKFRQLREQLATRQTWTARFALLETFFAGRFNYSLRKARSEICWAWQQLETFKGCVAVTDLSHELGWSHRHFVCAFRDTTGLTPKAAARYIRMENARRQLCNPAAINLCAIAARSGYSDQAHFTREFHALAGYTPSEYRDYWFRVSGSLEAAV